MKLCVGAVSRRVIEEAARLQVHQIVASRRQVDVGRGYTGLDQREFADLVRDLSAGQTLIGRDHGGPNQHDPLGIESMEVDVSAGFDTIHVDVRELPRERQVKAVRYFAEMLYDRVALEIGGARDTQRWNEYLLEQVLNSTGQRPTYVVLETGAHVWNDRQIGELRPLARVRTAAERLHRFKVGTKSHDVDWIPSHALREYVDVFDAVNVGPEVAQVEVRAIIESVAHRGGADRCHDLLTLAYESGAWQHWFSYAEGSWHARAECAVRYVLASPAARRYDEFIDDDHVRAQVRRHITQRRAALEA